ncbi:MAG: endonuclease III [Armatimonadetes bacterium]|nr:endonuclease III [Armatimonadota bacterium]
MEKIRQICTLLEKTYGRPECKPRRDPLEELIFTILSQNTSAANYTRAFNNLQEKFKSWDDVRKAPVADIEEAIRVGGLSKIKASRIKRILNEIFDIYGELSLDFLANMTDEEARNCLMRFEGIGIKTASCVLMFSLCRPVLPVDTHIHRVSKRLGLIGSDVSAEAAHGILQGMLKNEDVYSFHVNMVMHGRKVCKAQSPMCWTCCLLPKCEYGNRRLQWEESIGTA